jgi:hypothetical protein
MEMIEYTQKEALERALYYLENLYNEFIREIDAKTTDILRHQLLKLEKEGDSDWTAEKKFRHEWRKTSIRLHRRRSNLKHVKDRLACQIRDVRSALDRLEGTSDSTSIINPGFFYSVPAFRPGTASIVC